MSPLARLRSRPALPALPAASASHPLNALLPHRTRGKGSSAKGAASSAVGALERRFTGGADGGGLLEQTAALVAHQRLQAESMERVAKVLLGLLELEPGSAQSDAVALLQLKAVSAVAAVFRHCADVREVLLRDLTDILLRPTEREVVAIYTCACAPPEELLCGSAGLASDSCGLPER